MLKGVRGNYMQRKKNKIKWSIIQLVIFSLGMCLGIFYYIQIEIDADMSSSIIVPYCLDNYYGQGIYEKYNIWSFVRNLSYNMFGICEGGVKFIFSFFYCIICILVF